MGQALLIDLPYNADVKKPALGGPVEWILRAMVVGYPVPPMLSA
jgi:hypothetical protein